MSVNVAVLNQGLEILKTRFQYAGLVNLEGIELSGGNPKYARQAVSWEGAYQGSIKLVSGVSFNIPSGSVVAGWQIYDNVKGGIAFGVMPLSTETYTTQGTFTLTPALTEITVTGG